MHRGGGHSPKTGLSCFKGCPEGGAPASGGVPFWVALEKQLWSVLDVFGYHWIPFVFLPLPKHPQNSRPRW